jgi:ASC-1-like (ASCH) protein
MPCSEPDAEIAFILPRTQVHANGEYRMPLFPAKKEIYAWLKDGKKNIEVRKGQAKSGDTAVFQCGASYLRFPIVKRETGKLAEVIRKENYKQVIPTAECLEEALNFFQTLYCVEDCEFTAYYLKKQTE